MLGAASSPNLGAQQGCLQECPSFPCAVIAPPLFLLIRLDMGSDIWVRPLGPIAPQGVAWMHFPNVAEALYYLCSEEGGPLRIQHTQVTWAAKANATQHGYAFTFDEPSSLVVASPARSQRTAAAPAPNLSTFGFTAVGCACCGANICGTKHTCSRCHRVVDEACNLWKDWYNVFHVLVVHVGTIWHPTLLNVMHVISVCIPPPPLMVFVRGVPRGSPCRLTLFLRHVSSPMHGS